MPRISASTASHLKKRNRPSPTSLAASLLTRITPKTKTGLFSSE